MSRSLVAASGRVGIDLLTATVGWLHRHRRTHPPCTRGPVKVNLGCGMAVAPGWVNVDGSLNAWIANMPAWLHRLAYRVSGAHAYYSYEFYRSTLRDNVFLHHNLSYGLPFADKTADYIYCSHFLEHLDPRVGKLLLQDCRRVIKDDGVVRIVIPDLSYAWQLYQRGDKARMLHDFFFVQERGAFAQHRYAYDFEMLSDLLKSVGFSQVCQRSFREGWTPDLDELDNRADYSLYVEAKP